MAQPTNKNMLSSLGFRFGIKKLPATNFFVTQANIPGLSVNLVNMATPFKTLPMPSDKVTFNELSITFKVDEDMKNYIELFDWIVGMGFPKDFDQRKALQARQPGEGLYSDGFLSILTSAQNGNIELSFKNLLPVSLTDIQMSSQQQDVDYIEATASFAYTYYEFRRLSEPVAP